MIESVGVSVVVEPKCHRPEMEIQALRAFAQAVLADWPDSSPDGFDLQDLAIKHGLLVGTPVDKPCRDEGCACAEYGDFPQTCYRRSALLTGDPLVEPGYAKAVLRLHITDAQTLHAQAVLCAAHLPRAPHALRDEAGRIDLIQCLLTCLMRVEISGCEIRYSLVHLE